MRNFGKRRVQFRWRAQERRAHFTPVVAPVADEVVAEAACTADKVMAKAASMADES